MQDTLTITKLSWRNFRSYGNNMTTLMFGKPGVTAITGRIIDKTTHGNTNNGVGKSTIGDALTWCLYDKSISGVKVDELINDVNQKNMEVHVEFSKGGREYVVSRYRKLGKTKANGVKLLIDGDDKTLDSVDNTNKEIERILGMPYDTFVLIVVITASKDSFLDRPVKSASGANQTDFFEWMFNLTLLTDKAETLKLQQRQVADKLKDLKSQQQLANQLQEQYQKSLKQAEKRIADWNDNHSRSILQTETTLQHLTSIDADEQLTLNDLKNSTKKKIDELTITIGELNTVVKQSTQLIKKTTIEISHLQDNKCPYCLQSYHTADNKLSDLGQLVTEHEQIVATNQPLIDALNKQLAKQKNKLTQINESIVIEGKQLTKLSEDIAVLNAKLSTLRSSTNPMIPLYEDIVNNPPEVNAVDTNELNELDKLAKHQEFLFKLLTKKDSFIRKNLLAKAIPFLNSRLQHYLSKLDAEYKVEFDLELTARITAFGKERSYRSLSNGQKAKVNIVIPFAFRDVLQKMYGQVNICMCDEILDFGLDETGVALAAGMIRSIAKEQATSLYVISHKAAASDGYFDNQIVIEMEKRFSNIVHQ